MRADHLFAAGFIAFLVLAMVGMFFLGPWLSAHAGAWFIN